MKYTVINEQGSCTKNILPQGEHIFEIVRAEDLISKNNNAMLKLTLKVEVNKEKFWIYDYLSEKIPWRIKNFMDAINMSQNYSLGEIVPEDCLGEKGKIKVVQEYSEEYGIQSVISYYIGDNNEN